MKTLWKNNHLSLLESQRLSPDYLNSQFPREISGWHRFSKAEQDDFRQWERERMGRDGYRERPDGSWARA